MASRYWVGGTAAWDGTAGSKWALTSGGVGGLAVPTASDDVFLDANSGAVTVTVQTAVAVGGSVNCTGFTGTLVQTTNMNIGSATAGDFILSSGMTFTFSAGAIKLTSTKALGNNIDLAGKTVGNFTINGNGSTFTLLNHIVASAACAFSGGAVDFNGFNVTCGNLSNGNTLTRTVNMRGGTITITGTGAIFDAPAGVLTFTWTTGAKFVISNTSASAKTFAGGTNTTYPLIQVAGGASAGTVTFSGAFTCAGFIWDADSNVVYTISTTYTATSLLSNGTSGHNASVKSSSAGTAFTLSVASQPSVSFITLKDSTASGGTPFKAYNSTSTSGNTNWAFVTEHTNTLGLVYVIQLPPTTNTITKGLVYKVRASLAAITKTLKYTIKGTPATLTKSLAYKVRTSHAALTKSLKYAVVTTPVDTRLWTPRDATMPDWWIDASQLTGKSDGDAVSSWDDESGNLVPAINGAFNAPHYKVNIINGKPVVRFVASNNEALRALPNTGAGAMSMFVVGKLNGGTNARLVGGIYPLLRNWLIGWWNNTEDSMYAEGFVNSGGAATTAVKVYSTVMGATTSFYNQGNVIASGSAYTANINNGVALSGYDMTGSSELSDGDIAEVLIYDSALSTGDRQRLEGYLAWKYGTQAQLDVSHPYYAAAPTTGSGAPALNKSLTYRVRKSPTLTKSLKYTIKNFGVTLTKSLKYAIKGTPATLTKSLVYKVRASHSAITKSLTYDVRSSHAAITKSLKYTVRVTPSTLTKSLVYKVRASHAALTKSLTYDVRSAHAAITKGLVYRVRVTAATLTKSLAYRIRHTAATLTKSLTYKVRATPATLTKSLKYSVKAPHTKTLSLTYGVIAEPILHLSLKYVLKAPHTLTKSLTYTVLKDPYHKHGGLYTPVASGYTKETLYTPTPSPYTKRRLYTPF